MRAQQLVVVDGYNLILRTPALRPGPERTLAESRRKLVNLLSWAVGTGEACFVVIFDGSEQSGRDERSARVEVRFSRPPEKADDLIRRMVEDQVERVERLTVVTSDLEVARHARAMGATVALADLFVASLLGPAPGAGAESEKPTTMTKQELERWVEIFRGRSPHPSDDESG